LEGSTVDLSVSVSNIICHPCQKFGFILTEKKQFVQQFMQMCLQRQAEAPQRAEQQLEEGGLLALVVDPG